MEVSGNKIDTDDDNATSVAGLNVQIYCEPCNKDDVRLTAHGYCQDCMEHLCETCYKTHRKPAPCRHHVLLDRTQMPMSQSSGQPQVPTDLTEQCNLHKGKLVEYICHDHNILGCSPCVTINHRNCKVDYIPDVSKNHDTSDEYKQIYQSLAYLQKQFKAVIEETKANKKELLMNKSLVQDDIKKFRQEIIKIFDDQVRNLLTHVDEMFTMESARMDSLSSRLIEFEKATEELQDEMNKLERANKINALYIHSIKNQDVVQKLSSAEKQACEDNYMDKFVFQPNMNLKKSLRSEVGICEVQRKETFCPHKDSNTIVGSFETLTAKYCGEINVKVPSDDQDCRIPGAVLIAKDTVAVADSVNMAVKIVNTKIKRVTSEKRFSSRPTSLELLPNNMLAVTLTSDKTIVFLSISNGLSEVRRLKLEGECKNLAYCNKKLIVAFWGPGKIQILSLDRKMNKFKQETALTKTFDSPRVASGVNENIYISDRNSGTIACMNLNGDVLKSYKHERLINPCGIAVLDDGSILVCSSGNNSVFLISENLEKGRVILEEKDGLLCPYSFVLDKEKNKVYVGSGKKSNFLKMYEFN